MSIEVDKKIKFVQLCQKNVKGRYDLEKVSNMWYNILVIYLKKAKKRRISGGKYEFNKNKVPDRSYVGNDTRCPCRWYN